MAGMVDAAAAGAGFQGGPHAGFDGALAEGLAVDVHVHRFATNQQFAVAGAVQLEAQREGGLTDAAGPDRDFQHLVEAGRRLPLYDLADGLSLRLGAIEFCPCLPSSTEMHVHRDFTCDWRLYMSAKVGYHRPSKHGQGHGQARWAEPWQWHAPFIGFRRPRSLARRAQATLRMAAICISAWPLAQKARAKSRQSAGAGSFASPWPARRVMPVLVATRPLALPGPARRLSDAAAWLLPASIRLRPAMRNTRPPWPRPRRR